MNTVVHDFKSNLDYAHNINLILLRARVRKFYELVHLGVIDIEQPSYEFFGKKREQEGTDTQLLLADYSTLTIQEKFRTPKYWPKRNKDLFIELRNNLRPKKLGWFWHYFKTVDNIGFYFIKDRELSEMFFILYNSSFFPIIKSYIKNHKREKKLYFPPYHLQKVNGKTGGKTSGCVVQQKDLMDAEIARFYFNGINYIREYKDLQSPNNGNNNA
ncbi:MAG TPA: hypothetical protein VMW42_06120 [Desulfatiglandales bacterium]|nr:hypothetical protein [Desulfatiglandales bacterium]